MWEFVTGGFLVTVIALLTWFLQRFVSKNDERHDKIEKKIGDHEDKIEVHIDKMKSVASRMEKNSNEMHSKSLQFQQEVNNNLIKFKDQVIEINNELNRIEGKAEHINGAFERIKKDTTTILDTLDAHHKSLSLGAKAMAGLRERMDSMESNIKSIKVSIGKDAIMLKKKIDGE